MPPARRKNNSIGPRFVANIVPWIETYYHNHKVFPTDSLLMTQFRMDREKLDALLRSKLFKSALEHRGIERRSHLTPTQVACISVVTNFADTRPQDVKLSSIGVTPEIYRGWLSNSSFKRELAARAEEILEISQPDVLAVLANKARSGNLSAIKMIMEMTGRMDSAEQMNAKKVLVTVLESLQTHIKDPEVLLNIQRDILGEAPQVASLEIESVREEAVE